MPSTLIKQLLDAGVHFGHQTKRWNPKMKRFIFGSHAGIYIIDLNKTEMQLTDACAFVEDLAAKGQPIIFVGTKKQARAIIVEQAQRCGMPYVSERWLGGTMTNFETIRKSLRRLVELRAQKEDGTLGRLPKKEAKRLERQLGKLETHLSGLVGMEQVPPALFIIDPKREQNAVHEANVLKIPIVAICDTNADPDLIAYPIPGNDDALRAIRLIVTMIADSVIKGRRNAGLPIAGETPAEPAAFATAEATSDVSAESESA